MAGQQAATSETDEGQITLIDHLTELQSWYCIGGVSFYIFVERCLVAGLNKQQHCLSCICVFAGAVGRYSRRKGGGRMVTALHEGFLP